MALTTVPASLSATALTLTTAAQPNITSVGTLTSLTVSGNTALTLNTSAQPNITSVGTLTGLNTTGDITVTKNSARIRAIESGGATTQIAAGTATGYVGTYSNDPLQILSNSTAAITIDTSQSATFAGNIIGTDIKAAGSGGLTLQTDEGTKRLEILDNGNITVNHSSFSSLPTGSKLNIFGDGITLRLDGSSATTKSILFRGTNVANPGEVYADGSLRFRTEDASTRITFHINSSGSNNERMRIDSNGNLLVGTQSNDTSASMGGQTPVFFASGYTSLGGLRINGSDTGNTIYRNGGDISIVSANNNVKLETGGSGKVIVGAIQGGADGTLAVKTNSNTHAIAIEEASGSENYQLGVTAAGDLGFYNSGATDPTVVFSDADRVGIGRTPSTAVNLDIQDESSSTLAGLRIRNRGQVAGSAVKAIWSLNRNASDVDFEAGSILVGKQQNWTATASTVDAYMSFSTTENEVVYERMRLHPGGSLTIGSDTTSFTDETKVMLFPGGGLGNIYNMAATNEWWIMNNLANQSGYTTKIDFRVQNSSKGYIGITGSTVIYYSNSDYRLKENYNYDFDATSLVKAMKPLEFTWKEEPMVGKQMGFLAHELKEVTPYVVQGDKDEVRDDGEIRPQVVDQGKLVAVLTKALQEALVRIETLETEVTALKG